MNKAPLVVLLTRRSRRLGAAERPLKGELLPMATNGSEPVIGSSTTLVMTMHNREPYSFFVLLFSAKPRLTLFSVPPSR
jgi:hypothetical protein